MAFAYPPNLIDLVKERWNRHHGPKRFVLVASGPGMRRPREEVTRIEPGSSESIPFPSDQHLLTILEAVYHSSFLIEEGRRISLRVNYIPPSLPSEDRLRVLNQQGTVTRLLQPRPVSPAELLRLAPAVDPSQSMILVGTSAETGEGDSDVLVMWGLLHLGSEWWDLVSGRSTGAICPPHSMTVTTSAPGDLVVSSGGSVLLRLRNGTLLDASPIELAEGAIGDFLRPAADALYAEVCTALKRPRYADDDSDDHPRQQYYGALLNILRRTEERRHGGSFVIVADELDTCDSRLADRITIKYTLDAPSVWQDIVHEAVATHKFHKELFPRDVSGKTRSRARKRGDQEDLYWAGQRCESLRQKIHDFEMFVASLSGVDGAVVMTKRLKVLGFGGEITATSPTLSHVRLAGDATGVGGTAVPITSFGTRHRSACRFCSSFEDALCFVVSQDGQVKGVKRVGPQVVMWNDLMARNQVL